MTSFAEWGPMLALCQHFGALMGRKVLAAGKIGTLERGSEGLPQPQNSICGVQLPMSPTWTKTHPGMPSLSPVGRQHAVKTDF